MRKGYIYCFFILLATAIYITACSKQDTVANVDDERLNRPYCNDPEAINFNWDFPGKPDNSKCFYPIDVMGGSYTFTDSILDGDFKKDTVLVFPIKVFSIDGSKVRLGITGFCSAETLRVTADRFYKAFLDSTTINFNGFDNKLGGQFMCRTKDTVSGYMEKSQTDNTKLSIFFTVASDTGISYHKGVAIKQ
ncbi:hypothetical protein CAP35_14140 [Chitinophagaceae bacterium IBVUCB1]|nr:hypothetical protein CAP35_14140 [Chitinophagaceae bacterium IBVUCB1]